MNARDDQREALADLISGERDKYPRRADDMDSEELADAILAAGYRKHPEPETTDETVRDALVTYLRYETAGKTRAMRAALRAALRVPGNAEGNGEGEQ